MINPKYRRQWKLVTKKGYVPHPSRDSLSERRFRKGLGLRQVARLAGISHTHLICIEKGTRTASAETAEAISNVISNWSRA